MEKEKDILCRGKSIKNTFAAVLFNRLQEAHLIGDDYLAPPGDLYELTKAIGMAGLKELESPISKYYLMKTYSDLSNKVDSLTGRTPDLDEVYKWFFPMKIDYVSEADIKSLTDEDEEITVDSKPSDIRVAHTDYGNFIVSVKGDIIGIADKEALKKLKVSEDPFIEFSAYEDIAVKVDPIEEKVRRDMERQGNRFLYKGVDISNTLAMENLELLRANGLVDDDYHSTSENITDLVKDICNEGYKSVTTGTAMYSFLNKKVDELIKEKKDMNNNASAVIQDAKTGETTHIHNGVKDDPVDHPAHYCTADLFYVKAECIQVTQLLSFALGNVIKYIWRLGNKDNAEQEAKKACWYLDNAFKYPVETGREPEALGILSVLAGNDIVDNMKIVLMQDILNAFINGVHMDKDKEIHNRIMNLAQSIKD